MLTSIGPNDTTLTFVMVVYKCAGEPCKAMDWNADIDSVYTEAPLQRDKVEKDVKGKSSREILADKDGTKLVLAATICGVKCTSRRLGPKRARRSRRLVSSRR